jgi:hypothetical protein
MSLNGTWEFAIDRTGHWVAPDQVCWDASILVPFAPETELSGVADTGFHSDCWYRRTFPAPALEPGQRLLLHFGAVDHRATVWLNGTVAVRHEGGYTPFSADLTPLLRARGPQVLVVHAHDDPQDLAKPRGKQDWLLEPHAIWYPRTTGIWQTVWVERVPASAISNLRWSSSLEDWDIGLHVLVDGPARDDLRLRTRLHVGDLVLADDTYRVANGEVHRRVALSDPGIDDSRNELLWSPESPTLIQAELQLLDGRGEIVDAVQSYTALRSVGIQGDRFVLNGRPYRLGLVLDQGYWPASGLTPPDDAALRRDVELAKAMGFNGVRKHQKIEDPRYLYWADALGLLIWEEMPSAYRFTRQAVRRLTREWMEVLDRDGSHPCVVTFVPLNESWGVPDLGTIEEQRSYVQALYHLTKTLDGLRPVVGNDGWEAVATDLIGIHDYDDDPQRIGRRYASDEILPRLFRRERPGGRVLTVEGHPHAGQPIVLSEFGGIALTHAEDAHRTWGYTRVVTAREFGERYQQLMAVIHSLSLLAGSCYTQFADTYQEANGLLTSHRTPKIPVHEIHRANRETLVTWEDQLQQQWESRMQRFRREQRIPRPEAAWVESPESPTPANAGELIPSPRRRHLRQRKTAPRAAP